MITQARLLVAGVTLAAILALAGYVYLTRKAIREANARVTAAEQSTDLATATTAEVEKVARTEITIRQTSERQADVVQAAPGADAVLPDAFVDSLRGAVGVLREPAQAGSDQRPAATP
jgi:Tfp pilus assembly protein PilN